METNDIWSQYGEEFSAGDSFKKPWTVPDNGSIELAFLTQMGELRTDPNGWFRGHKRHWGYSIPRKDDPTKSRKITFRCLEKRGKGGIVFESCPQDVKYEGQEEAAKQYEVDLRREKRSEEEIKQLMGPLNGWLRSFSKENKVWMFAMNPAGEFNKFTCSWKTFFQLRDKMNEFEKEMQKNPRSPRNLAFWKITRTGSSKSVGQMSESVERVLESVDVNGKMYLSVKMIALTEEQLRKGAEAYASLGSLDQIDTFDLTHAQVRALSECNEDPEAVAAIINIPQSNKATEPTARVSAPPPAPPAPAAPPPAATATVKTEAPVDDEEEAALAAVAAIRKKKAAAAALVTAAAPTTAVSPPAPPPAPVTPTAQPKSAADLLARLGLKTSDIKGPAPAAPPTETPAA